MLSNQGILWICINMYVQIPMFLGLEALWSFGFLPTFLPSFIWGSSTKVFTKWGNSQTWKTSLTKNYYIFSQMENLQIGRIKPCKWFYLILAQIQLSQFRQITKTLKRSDFIFSKLEFFQFWMSCKSLEFFYFVLD